MRRPVVYVYYNIMYLCLFIPPIILVAHHNCIPTTEYEIPEHLNIEWNILYLYPNESINLQRKCC